MQSIAPPYPRNLGSSGNVEHRISLVVSDNRERSHDGLHVTERDMVNSYSTISSHVRQHIG